MISLTRNQIFLMIGFAVILVSIPLTSILVKNSQIFKSRAAESKTAQKVATSSATKTPVTKLKEVPASSPLTDLEKLMEGSRSASPTVAPLVSPTPILNIAVGPTLKFKVNLEGRPTNKQNGKVLVGIATGAAATKPKYALTYNVDTATDGSFSGLSLAGLTPASTYTAYIKGPAQIDASSTFTMSAAESVLNNDQALLLLSGDLNEDNTINSADYTIAKSIYGATPTSPNWNSRADFNDDGIINNIDLVYITKNMGKTGASDIWYSPPPVSSGSASLNISTPSANTGGYDASENSSTRSGGYDSPNGSSNRTGGYWLWIPPQN